MFERASRESGRDDDMAMEPLNLVLDLKKGNDVWKTADRLESSGSKQVEEIKRTKRTTEESKQEQQ